ncbi:MAG: 23S rRNA (guanosine(2251)-2'-O)-methyltransferase RlmB [Gammaproteobacteria bacterium]|nr:23S rRNA (guanosine(2251)-2'-O)-methyltransferase RlmB [Gammaproteobacteria bacterium]
MSESYIYGIHAVEKFIQQSSPQSIELVATEGRNPRLLSVIGQARKSGIPLRYASRDELNELVGNNKHQGCVLQIEVVEGQQKSLEQCLTELNGESLFLVLDGVQDPHNLGACLRTSDAAGVDAVIIPRDRSVSLNATVRKVSAGAAESVPLIEVTNLSRCLKMLKDAGVWIYGTSGDAESSLYDFAYQGPVALVMGAEGSGLRRLTAEQCDYLVSLPMRGVVESLNVSVATGVCLFEIDRSRRQLTTQG